MDSTREFFIMKSHRWKSDLRSNSRNSKREKVINWNKSNISRRVDFSKPEIFPAQVWWTWKSFGCSQQQKALKTDTFSKSATFMQQQVFVMAQGWFWHHSRPPSMHTQEKHITRFPDQPLKPTERCFKCLFYNEFNDEFMWWRLKITTVKPKDDGQGMHCGWLRMQYSCPEICSGGNW